MENKPDLRQYGSLTSNDFRKHSVWVQCHIIDYDEPWYDDTDEETFRPWLGPLPVDPSEAMFLVAADFNLADGSSCDGFLTPATDGDPFGLGTIQPVILADPYHLVPFWFGGFRPSSKQIAPYYELLQREAHQVFPVRYAAKPGLADGVTSGTIEGFAFIGENDQTQFIR